MRRFWLLTIALFLMWADLFYTTDIKYPEYEFNEMYGRKTQMFIMDEVVGDNLQVDLLSDVPALLILIVLVCIGGPNVKPVYIIEENGKRIRKPRGRMTRCGKRSIKYDIIVVLCAVLSLEAIALIRFLPFYTSGVDTYGGEYFTRLADIFLPLCTVYYVMSEWIRRTCIMSTEMETRTAGLMMMLSLFAGFFSHFAGLYQFPKIHYISWLLEGFMMGAALFMLYISLQENGRKIECPLE